MKRLLAGGLLMLIGCSSASINPFSGSSFNIKPYSETELSNGLKVLLVEDKSLPYTSFSMMFGTGAAHDPNQIPGLTNFVGDMFKKGTQKSSAMQIVDRLEQLGASLEISTGYDYTEVSASGLSFHRETILSILAELITEANFADSEIQRLKKQTIDGIKKISEKPDSFADMSFGELLYNNHPYGHPVMGTVSGIGGIKQKHVVKHYLQYFRPNNAVLAVVGNYDSNIIEVLEKSFARWKPRNIDDTKYPTLNPWQGIKLEVIDKADLVQTQVRIGHVGIKRDNPDFLKLRIANTILGSGFTSRLMQSVRVKAGLTYGISAAFDARKDFGPFIVAASTRNDKVGELIRKTLGEVEKFRDEGVTEQEVNDAKALLIGNFPRSIETAERLAFNLLTLRLYKISDYYLTDFVENVRGISAEDINEAIRKYYQPKNLKILVFSNANAVKSQLSALGEVTVRSYSTKR
ncbi:MAG: pitrilysin family protein [Pseudomonadota bacterium]|nr:pitrilysin family protein [Pseudomonadota bacterium]